MTGIYYADLFVINGNGCLVMGYGKTKTCRNYTGEGTEEIGIDSIRFENTGRELYGYFDPTMGFVPFKKENSNSTKIKYLIRMLNEEETKYFKCNAIAEIDKQQFLLLCDYHITFGISNVEERRKEFKNLIDSNELICIVVPWCNDMQAKGKLIEEFIK